MAACSKCGTEPLANARFCHECGAPVSAADAQAEYKQVTVWFAGDGVMGLFTDEGVGA